MAIGRWPVEVRERLVRWYRPGSSPRVFDVPTHGELNTTEVARLCQAEYGIEGVLGGVIQDVDAILRKAGHYARRPHSRKEKGPRRRRSAVPEEWRQPELRYDAVAELARKS
jgi:hypothetical protein